jgi:hypothetical protein
MTWEKTCGFTMFQATAGSFVIVMKSCAKKTDLTPSIWKLGEWRRLGVAKATELGGARLEHGLAREEL